MIKEKYERTELEIIKFQTEDVICTSNITYEDDETELIKKKTKNQYITKPEQAEEEQKTVLLLPVSLCLFNSRGHFPRFFTLSPQQ